MRRHLQFVYGSIAVFMVGLVPCPIMGQVLPKQQLTEADYRLWGTMELRSISEKGSWVVYHTGYESGADTLFVRHTASKRRYTLAGIDDGRFCDDHTFGYLDGDGFHLLDLKSGTKKTFYGVTHYYYSKDNYIVLEKKGELLVLNPKGQAIDTINNVISYAWNPAMDAIAVAVQDGIYYQIEQVALGKSYAKVTLADRIPEVPVSLIWNNPGDALAFYGTVVPVAQATLYLYRFKDRRLYRFDGASHKMVIDSRPHLPLTISNDGLQVFFGIRSDTLRHDDTPENVAIWKGNAKKLYTKRSAGAVAYKQLLAVWWPDRGLAKAVSTIEESFIMLTGDQKYMVSGNSLPYEPRQKMFDDMDYYLTDLESGERKLFLMQQPAHSVFVSKGGRYIHYYKDNGWWVYHIANETHTKVTTGLNGEWSSIAYDPGNELSIYGMAQTVDENSNLYYDHYDIWLIAADGSAKRRLTKGRENDVRYRMASGAPAGLKATNLATVRGGVYNVDEPLLLSGQSLTDGTQSYYIRNRNGVCKPFTTAHGAASSLLKALKAPVYAFVEERYDEPPKITVKKKDGLPFTLVESNPQHTRYLWGRSEMIHYTNADGRQLNGALYYPAGYVPGKKFPMIVYIYSSVSQQVNHYVNPSLRNNIGFNIPHLTNSGYFVLLADIYYGVGNTGYYATDCVVSAARKVISMGLAEEGRIGLYGHSFGGYETNFIITQTDIFAAAISGSSVSDLVSGYLTYNAVNNTADHWRYENQQFRMGKSFFEDTESYYRNSPVANAANIRTPLLLWTGGDDKNVQPVQSMEMFLALRRLGKKGMMLVYPGEGHMLEQEQNQTDLTRRVGEWFDYFLKGSREAKWISEGVQ